MLTKTYKDFNSIKAKYKLLILFLGL
jgi:hypothetical protein